VSPLAPAFLKEAGDKICSGGAQKPCEPVLASSLFDAPNADYSLNLKVVERDDNRGYRPQMLAAMYAPIGK
jgi:hypothetical protein